MSLSNYKNLSIVLLLPAILMACSGEPLQTDAPEIMPPPVDVKTIPTTDELGSFQTPVSGITLWSHPTTPFESTIIAANGAAGLIMVNYESEPVTTITGSFNTGVMLSYIPTYQGTKTLIAARDDETSSIRLLKTGSDPVEMIDWTIDGDISFLSSDRSPVCLVKSKAHDNVVIIATDENKVVSAASITENSADILTVSGARELPVGDLATCASDDRHGNAYLLSNTGQILVADMFAESFEPKPFLELPAGDVIEMAVMLRGQDDGQILAMVSSGTYVIYVFDLKTAAPLGAFTLGEFSEIEAVKTISAFTADGTNFGGLYRQGTIAIIEGQDTYALKLAPWTAVRNILELPDTETLDRRTIRDIDRSASDGLIIDLPDLSTRDG